MPIPSPSLVKLPYAVLFDYDGVLVASEPIHLLAWKQLLISLGLPEDLELIQKSIGKIAPKILETLLNLHRPGWSKADYNLDDLAKKKNDFYLALVEANLTAYPGVREGLIWLRQNKVRTAVVSNAKGRELRTTLNMLNLTDFFDEIISRDDVFPNKPDPTPYLLAAQRLGLEPGQCIALEDSPPGLEAALRAGIPTIAISTNFPPEILRQPVLEKPDLTPIRIDPNIQSFFDWLKTLPRS
ncbi:MAG: HAD family phosphatase [Bdellovibrionia bacterium]